jgi:hypothetical protein
MDNTRTRPTKWEPPMVIEISALPDALGGCYPQGNSASGLGCDPTGGTNTGTSCGSPGSCAIGACQNGSNASGRCSPTGSSVA